MTPDRVIWTMKVQQRGFNERLVPCDGRFNSGSGG